MFYRFIRRQAPLGAFLILAAAPISAQQIVAGAIGAKADSALQALTTSGFSGVALVSINDSVVLAKGYGLADRAKGTPLTASSVVQIGSNTKDFTIVAILQLMERGKLALSDPITKYFPNVPADKRGITIDQLLAHEAGFAQHMGPDFEVVTRDQELTRAMAATLLFEPGTKREYSNIGYSLLAAIIEMTSGTSYDEFIRDNILKPLDLHDTGLLLPKFDKARVAHGYRDGKDMGTFLERPLASDGPYWNLRGNGGMLSTVGDMNRFYRALYSDGPLLKPASRDLRFHTNEPAVLSGSDLTWYFFYSRYPRVGVQIILVSNSTDYPAQRARGELAAAIGIADGGPGGGRGGRGGPNIVTEGGPPRQNGPVTLPDTPAGRAAMRYMAVNADGTPEAMRKFIDEAVRKRPDDQRTVDERVAAMQQMRRDIGTLKLTRVIKATATDITFEADGSDGPVTIVMQVEAEAPFRIVSMQITA